MNTSPAIKTNIELTKRRTSVIRRFAIRRVAGTATIFGLLAAIESIAQSIGIILAYPDPAARAKVIYGLASNPALGLFYGNMHTDIISPGGYMAYRIMPIMILVLSIWAMLFITKMLRGQEENGNWELLLSGRSSARNSTTDIIMGSGVGLVIIFTLTALALIIGGHSSRFAMPIGGSLIYSLLLATGALIGVAVGALTSQLASTRRKAVIYGLTIIIFMFAIRSIGNAVAGLNWIKNLSLFGWLDKVNPYNNAPVYGWLWLTLAVTILVIGLVIWLSGRRDMGSSLIADQDTSKPKLSLLNSQLGFSFKQLRNIFIGWLIASLSFVAVIVSIDKTVAKTITGSGGLTKTFSNLTGNPYARIEVAYLSAAGYFIVITLIFMIAASLGHIRNEESSGRIDNFIAGGISRLKWLTSRLGVIMIATGSIYLLASLIDYFLAKAQGIDVGFNDLIFGGINILGPVAFILGLGLLIYGILPRHLNTIIYAVVGWSFTIDIIAAALKLNSYFADSSIFKHMALVPAATPDWHTFEVLIGLALLMSVTGIWLFNRRDLVLE